MKKNFTNSDIFNSYIELAQKEGLISLAQDSSDSKKALDKNPRADSLSQERIGELYNVKPNAPKGMEYKRNIGEVAHSKPAIVGPAYDKLNALVESDNERQDILLHIVNKRTNGLLTQHKYAQEEMARALVRIANDMDNRNEDNLRTLADECLEGFTKKSFDIGEYIFRPETQEWLKGSLSADVGLAGLGVLLGALAPVFIGGAGATMLGGMAAGGMGGAKLGLVLGPLIAHLAGTPVAVKTLSENIEIVSKELTRLLSDKDIEKSNFKEFIQKYINDLSDLRQQSEAYDKDKKIFERIDKKIESKQQLSSGNVFYMESSLKKRNYGTLSQAFKNVEEDIQKFRSKHEAISEAALSGDYFGISVLQKAESFFHPIVKSLSVAQEIYMDEEALLRAISNFKEHTMSTKDLVTSSAQALKAEAEKMVESSGQTIEEYTREMGINPDILSNSSNTNSKGEPPTSADLKKLLNLSPSSNDNMTPEQKAAARQVIDFIKNS